MRSVVRIILTIATVALCATASVDAQTHHRSSKVKEPVMVGTPTANVPEKNRDPADVALDRKIKGICKGC
jgi:hypothetical protein